MQVTKGLLRTWFDELNGSCFDGELPVPRLETGVSRTRLGSMSCKWRRSLFRKQCYDHCIRLSNYYDLDEDGFRNVLLHEMIHYYISVKGIRDTSAHGRVFRQMAARFNADGWHVTVRAGRNLPVAEHVSGRVKERLALSLLMRNGERRITLVNPAYCGKLDFQLRSVREVAGWSWYKTKNPDLQLWPQVRTLRARRVNSGELDRLLAGAEPVNPPVSGSVPIKIETRQSKP